MHSNKLLRCLLMRSLLNLSAMPVRIFAFEPGVSGKSEAALLLSCADCTELVSDYCCAAVPSVVVATCCDAQGELCVTVLSSFTCFCDLSMRNVCITTQYSRSLDVNSTTESRDG